MKNIFLSLVLLTFFNFCKSQEVAKVAFIYTYKHQIDTTQKDYYYTERMVLLQGEHKSIYKSYDAYLSDSALQAKIAQSEQSINLTGLTISTRPLVRDMVLKDFKLSGSTQIRYLLEYYYWPENLHSIEWKILPDTVTIKGLKCQKATCIFKGREYDAWFSTDIPFNNGPWKLGGLPGLIIKATDSKNEIFFELEGYATLSNSSIGLPEKSHLSSEKEYYKVRDAYLNDPMSFLQNSGSIGGNVKLSNMSGQLKGKKPINNPIEIKEE